ncbi:LuxR C-terminal-related transcriptional regulator [Marinobacter sp. chi1]|uniref:LuxR C-terminal-related transcriptional regulator n=1 Tax=Marinobacter suaedae TaxID=3057675 RepID=A0ABT8W290_9GAMM|nr:LuxR C-terminal-related transcriptional regulator [Marinobacter sp. chi1]MDO3722358.1 LuxR C-terminal-related transcriptional regulator [Marinobacter sp. chi1]
MLLTTKFLRPSADSRAVRRDRLISLLHPEAPKRLNLVIAPAGFGKTTLASQWCSQTTSRTAWLSLDGHDNEPRRFWEYVVGAFEHAGLANLGTSRKLLSQESGDASTGAVTALLNTLAEDDSAWALVLDDFHFIQDPGILREFAYFIDYLHPGITVTITSRTEPALPLSRWRVRRWVQDINPGSLAFSEAECRQFFKDTMGVELSGNDAATIYRKTEGWVAAMQLSALSGRTIQGHSQPSPAGSHLEVDERHISDYVLTEVLQNQPEEAVQFLLDTACCPRLCASLCNSIRGQGDSQEKLEQLLSQNLFLIPLDNHNEWFRYHDLFRDALLYRLHQSSPERAKELRRETVSWLLDHGEVHEGIAQILQLEDWPWLASVLAEHGNNLIHGGYHLPVLGWIDALPVDLFQDSPQLQMLKIWGLFFANRVDTLEPLLTTLEDLLDKRVADSHPDAEGALGLQSEISLIRSYLARTRSDEKSASDLTRQVLKDIDHTQIPLKSVTYYGVGLDYYGQGNLGDAEDALRSAVHYGQIERKPSTVLSSGGLLAWIQYDRGDIDIALDTCTEVRRWVDQHYADPTQPVLISCWQNSALTEIFRETDRLEQASTYLAPLLEHVDGGTEPGQHVIIQYVRGHLAFSEGRLNEAVEFLEDAAHTGRKRRDHIVFEPPASEALLARCYLGLGLVDKARDCLGNPDALDWSNPLNREQMQISMARVLVASNKPEPAQEMLTSLMRAAEKNAHIRHQVEVLLVYAEALDLQSRQNEAREMLERALVKASNAGFLRLFVEESRRVRELLLELPSLKSPGSWNQRLLSMLAEQGVEEKAPERTEVPTTKTATEPKPAEVPLVEPLSQRELEVLSLINDGYANKEIAAKMDVAPATVKAHIRNLYGKLGVKRRTEAMVRARNLGLLHH